MLPISMWLACNDPSSHPGGSRPGHDDACVPTAGVVINELSPANRLALVDLDGRDDDWIELVAKEPTSLLGWSLSDDRDDPRKWAVPARDIAPGDFLIVHASGDGQSHAIASWDTRIDAGDTWRYTEITGPMPDWTAPGWDDSDWSSGPSGFGFEGVYIGTELATAALALRTTFTLSQDDVDDLAAVFLDIDYDDGFVAWIDGAEVARKNLGTPGLRPRWNERAASGGTSRLRDGLPVQEFDISSVIPTLAAGDHVLAIEVHDAHEQASDLAVVPFLTLGFASPHEGRRSAAIHPEAAELFANFALSADGEAVELVDPAGCVADRADPAPLLADESWGRQPDGTGEPGYFMQPTPGAANDTEWRAGFAEIPELEPPGGFVPAGTKVECTARAST